jgi:hypothetical protein
MSACLDPLLPTDVTVSGPGTPLPTQPPIATVLRATTPTRTVMSAAPTLVAGTPGQLLLLLNAGPAPLILQDVSQLAGTALQLRTPRVALPSGATLTLTWNGSSWQEIARSTAGGSGQVNVLDYGADPTGVADSSDAFTDAMRSFADAENRGLTLEHGFAGTVIVPYGKYRIAKPVYINRNVTFEGAGDDQASSVITADAGITPFIICGLAVPWGTTDLGSGGGAQIRNMVIRSAGKVPNWMPDTCYNVGDKVRTGTGTGEDWRRHQVCVQAGRSAGDGNGPRSLGFDQELTVSNRVGTFVNGERINGIPYLYDGSHTRSPGGEITGDDGTTFRLTAVTNVFAAGTTVTGAGSGATATVVSSNYPFPTLRYKDLTGGFQVLNGKVITGATSGATANIQFDKNDFDSGAGPTGFLMINNIQGTFIDGEVITDHYVGQAQVDGAVNMHIPQSEPDGTVRWSYLGNGSLVQMYVRASMDRVSVFDASGNGVHIEAQSLEQPNQLANANGWRMTNMTIYLADGHGLFLNGSDANAGYLLGADFGGNGSPVSDHSFTGIGYNIYDSSFLGNTYVQCQMASGGIGSVFCDSVGGGSTFLGCYVEGSGGGESIFRNGNTIIGGGLSVPNYSLDSVPAVLGPGGSRGVQFPVAGLNALNYDFSPGYHIPYAGVRVSNAGNVYQCTVPGTPDGIAPTGTGTGIADGQVRWDFVGPVSNTGYVALGSAIGIGGNNPHDFIGVQSPPDVGVSLGITYRDRGAVLSGVQNMYTWEFGNTSMVTYSMSHNRTLFPEWPMAPRAALALLDTVYIGAIRHSATSVAPTTSTPDYLSDTWNPGDRAWYKAGAVTPGGAQGTRCIAGGTFTPPNAVARTATSTGTNSILLSGSPLSTLRINADIHVGDYLTINGVTNVHVTAIGDDGLTLTTDVPVPAGSGLSVAFKAPVFEDFGAQRHLDYLDDSATAGNRTVNHYRGKNKIAAGSAAVTITNNRVTSDSLVTVVLGTDDATAVLKNVVCSNNQFVVNLTAPATGDTVFAWYVVTN